MTLPHFRWTIVLLLFAATAISYVDRQVLTVLAPALRDDLGISSAMFGFWAQNMMSLCADAFPRNAVGSVVGLSGMGAGVGGMLFTMLIGWTLDRYGYPPVFIAAGVIPLLAFVVLFVTLEREESPEDSLAKIDIPIPAPPQSPRSPPGNPVTPTTERR